MDIEAKGVTARYRDARVLTDVDLCVRTGEMVGLIGPNGSGKTTLLRILANLQTPHEGVVRYDGKTAAAFGARPLARRVAYLAQGGEVHWPMRADAVVALGRLPHRDAFGGAGARDRDAVERALVAADVVHLRARTMGQVSGGERMRILLARALAVDGDLLLADEPTTALDPLHQLQVMALLRATVQRGRGVVVVLHDLALAMRFCNRLVLLADGRVLDDGPPGRVLSDHHLARAYGVDVVRGNRDGVPFVLPWRPVDNETVRGALLGEEERRSRCHERQGREQPLQDRMVAAGPGLHALEEQDMRPYATGANGRSDRSGGASWPPTDGRPPA